MKTLPRSDKCYLVGKRAMTLNYQQAARAWYRLSADVEAMGDTDMPKFKHLLRAIRTATIGAKQK